MPATDVTAVRRALVSVYDKTGLVELARGLHRHGVEIVSTGSTAGVIRDADVPVTEVADVTGFPECLDGRVKTLHPKIHAGLLADRSRPAHLDELDELGVAPIDLVVSNLYPFDDAVASGAPDDDIIEMIDIGGPTMLRAAAKNFAGVGIVVDPDDYAPLVELLDRHDGLPAAARRVLATKAFGHVATYDAAISNWFRRDEDHPEQLHVALERLGPPLRYGENPHQGAAFYVDAQTEPVGLGAARQLHGKELSYNNYVDTDAAWAMACDFDEPCVAIIKHTNPAGLAVADDLPTAHERALAGDPVSAFGGIVAANRPIDATTAAQVAEVFTEVVIAPGYADGALEVLTAKKNLRILEAPVSPPIATRTLRAIDGGLLVQDGDVGAEPFADWEVASAARPDDVMLADLRFAWTVAKHVKSNAIVLVKDRAVVGVGAGQMSRVDAVRLAVEKSGDRHVGAVLASDAFFPFRDNIDVAAAAGIAGIVQPGGSVRDDEVVGAADEHDLVMVLTGRRHFRH
ncbi:bifunctional phosphoribosylaminoimidazolecarboxamide formyltransferase/IMP cyclohydrolase [Salsipaludibacter albus]|uniref:bifunctional phosphoribosylaminoimidazolecarboxamide formyltransferase/IMP cyclohydrolase n=1 Tax=Salsipaludibacter albus TaxID=2849650 RepID=UPI001EE45178|nr:bifunctional phosphoribosylaminoimidazolecarboxamide formyltransferase/IMP cyclohydrolase [Salsipaludibacter albus]MBY5161888.1 bifunctional phosphoribosylaminoimidazolecarboxamide formyltransferase/IMP cyclohydrolase [Salsipaludibacter albus]